MASSSSLSCQDASEAADTPRRSCGDGRPGESALKITVESHFSWIVISMSVLLLVAVALLVIFMVGHRRHRKELRMHFELAELSACDRAVRV